MSSNVDQCYVLEEASQEHLRPSLPPTVQLVKKKCHSGTLSHNQFWSSSSEVLLKRCVCVCVHTHTHTHAHSVAQSSLTLCDPIGCSPQGSFVHGIFQARILEWVAIFISRRKGSNKKRELWIFSPKKLTLFGIDCEKLKTSENSPKQWRFLWLAIKRKLIALAKS